MHIMKLSINNFMGIKTFALEEVPNDVVELRGKNGAGKTDCLDAICAVLQGLQAHPVKQPIYHGADKAEIVCTTESWTARRIYTEKGTQLQVFSNDKDGNRVNYDSPQALLNKVLGDLSFSPVAFQHMKPEQQTGVLMQLANLDFSAGDETRKECYTRRAEVNREIKKTEGVLTVIPSRHEGVPDQEVLAQDILNTKRELERKKQAFDQHLSAIEEGQKLANQAWNDFQDTQQRIQELQAKAVRQETAYAERQRHVEQLQAIDIQAVTDDQVQAVENMLIANEETNRKVRENHARAQHEMELETSRADQDELTGQIQALDEAKADAIATATYPLPGLGLRDGMVTFHDTLFAQVSTGEAIRVSTAIAMALNPKLKVIFIRDASLLDRDGHAIIRDMARENGYQIWIETVADEPGPTGFYIEEGELALPKRAKEEGGRS